MVPLHWQRCVCFLKPHTARRLRWQDQGHVCSAEQCRAFLTRTGLWALCPDKGNMQGSHCSWQLWSLSGQVHLLVQSTFRMLLAVGSSSACVAVLVTFVPTWMQGVVMLGTDSRAELTRQDGRQDAEHDGRPDMTRTRQYRTNGLWEDCRMPNSRLHMVVYIHRSTKHDL